MWARWGESEDKAVLDPNATAAHPGAGLTHHDLGWQEALSVTGHGLQAFLCVPVQVLTRLIQGAV